MSTRTSVTTNAETELLRQITARLDPVALGVSLSIVCGAVLLVATNVLVLKGGPHVGSHLVLLSQYFPGYRVSPAGSLAGAAYAASAGFVFGWLAAHLRNLLLNISLRLVRVWSNLTASYFLDRFD